MKRKPKKTNIKRVLTFMLILAGVITLAATSQAITISIHSETNQALEESVVANYTELLDTASFNEVKNSAKSVIMFTSNWCGACSRMKDQLKSLAQEFIDVKFYVADIEKFRDISNTYNVAITLSYRMNKLRYHCLIKV